MRLRRACDCMARVGTSSGCRWHSIQAPGFPGGSARVGRKFPFARCERGKHIKNWKTMKVPTVKNAIALCLGTVAGLARGA